MKMGNQTPQKQQSRSLDSTSRRSKESLLKRSDPRDQVKNPQKIVRKSLNSSFIDVSGDLTPETSDSLPESEVLNETWLSESVLSSPLPVHSASSETSRSSDFASLLDFIEDKQEGDITVESKGFGELDSRKSSNIIQIFMDLLHESRFQVSNTSDVNLQSKRILDALITVLLTEELSFSLQDRDQFTDLASEKVRIGFFCFFLWMVITVSIVFLSKYASRSSSFGPPPT